jgi:phosphatidylserine/phosphatidylglycerophosphate/cardiolipin synthase-like enzyme
MPRYHPSMLMRAAPLFVLALAAGLLTSCERPAPSAGSAIPQQGTVSVFFSPKGGCTEAIVKEIAQAQRTLDIQAYSFTSVPIAQAVTAAAARGVAVRAVLDDSQRTERYSEATFLRNHQIPVFIDDRHKIAHNKIIIIDGQTLITGSFNFSKAAEEDNAENLLIFHGNADLVGQYARNFELHLKHAQAYDGK